MERKNVKNGKIWLMCITVPEKFDAKENVFTLHHFIVSMILNRLDPISVQKGTW